MKRFALVLLALSCDPQKELNKAAAEQVANAEAQVAADSVAQYDLVKRNGGSAIELCTHAGLVTAAYLQAKDEANYVKWHALQKSDCQAAGLPE